MEYFANIISQKFLHVQHKKKHNITYRLIVEMKNVRMSAYTLKSSIMQEQFSILVSQKIDILFIQIYLHRMHFDKKHVI